MQIVDAKIHTWGTGLPSNLSSFTPTEAIDLMDEDGVDARDPSYGLDPRSTEMSFKTVRDYPERFAITRSVAAAQSGALSDRAYCKFRLTHLASAVSLRAL
jgi:hypothetical protein